MKINDLSSSLPVHPTKKPTLRKLVKRIVIHTTDWLVSPEDLAKYDIRPNHISNTGCPTITYHYLINQDGGITKTANHEVVTWHVGNWNASSLGIALVYKTDPEIEKALAKGLIPPLFTSSSNQPSAVMMTSLQDLLIDLCIDLDVPPQEIVGHRELFGTGWFNDKGSKRLRKTCPGMVVDLDKLRATVTLGLQSKLKELGHYIGNVDGKFGKNSKKALTAANKQRHTKANEKS